MTNWADLTWPAIAALPRTTPIVFPVAALEQHGHHLPVFTDSLLLGEVVRRAAGVVGDGALFAPLTWLGNSHHHLDFAGTLSARPRGYIDGLIDLASCAIDQGFTRIVFLNGHGGNDIPGRQAMFELRQQLRQRADLLLLFATYWDCGDPLSGRSDFVQTRMGHACEWETSMMLRLAPHLVVGDVSTLESVSVEFGFDPAYRGWTSKDRTAPGHMGRPQFATAEKGEHLFDVYSRGVAALLDRVRAWDGVAWLP